MAWDGTYVTLVWGSAGAVGNGLAIDGDPAQDHAEEGADCAIARGVLTAKGVIGGLVA
mgnify:CR=1 FL=1